MREPLEIKRILSHLLGTVALVMLGVGIAFGLMELLLRARPDLVPREVRVNPPARRVNAFVDETYAIKLSDGDLFHWMQEVIAPLPPDQDKVVARVHMTTDAHGFRNPLPEKSTYEIVALGDSYTRASGVAIPWPQKLAEATGSDVLNLGDVGFGPQDELQVLRQYGLKKRPQWVIMAYFGGNDLYDAAAYELAVPYIMPRFVKYLLSQGIEAWRDSRQGGAQAAEASGYRYPITVTINDTGLEMAFFSSYIGWLSLGGEVIESSQDYRLVRETIMKARDSSEAAGSRFLLVYLPTKEHIYLPYLNDAETLANVFADVPTLELDEAGFIQFSNRKATLALVRQHMDDQANLLSGFAAQHDINYLDLTPYFQEVAGTGTELYFPYDTHWNQNGHDLAAKIIAGYIQ